MVKDIMQRGFWVESFILLGKQIFVFSFFILLLSAIHFFLGIHVNWFTLPISFVLSFLALMTFDRRTVSKFTTIQYFVSFFLLLIVYIFSFFVSSYFYDVSCDGQEYHQGAFLQMTNEDYNPYLENIPDEPYSNMWIQHYAKGSEILASSVYVITKNVESAKVFNLLFIFASLFMGLGVFLRRKEFPIWLSALLAFIIAFNPISSVQFLSFYLDGQLASCLIGLIFAGYLILEREDRSSLLLWLSIEIILINLKFTGILFAAVFCVGFLCLTLFRKNKNLFKKSFISMLIAGILGIVFIGFNPYVKNTLDYGNPFYPLMGENSIDIMTTNTPPEIRYIGRVRKFLVGTFLLENNDKDIIFRSPFFLNKQVLQKYHYTDTRIGGFGPYFMEISILSFILAIILLFYEKKYFKYFFVLCLTCISLVIAVSNEAWWARYVPTLFILPWAILVYSYVESFNNFFQKLLLLLLCVNAFLITYVYISGNIKSTNHISDTIHSLQEAEQPIKIYFPDATSRNIVQKFYENDIEFEEIVGEDKWKEITCEEAFFWGSAVKIKYNIQNP